MENDVGAGPVQCARDGGTDAPRRSGDERRPAAQRSVRARSVGLQDGAADRGARHGPPSTRTIHEANEPLPQQVLRDAGPANLSEGHAGCAA